MAYNNIISRTNDQALIPEVVSNDILSGLQTTSASMSLFRKIPMATNQTRMPVLAALPTAYFVQGDTGLKQTTQVAWSNKFLNVEELAAIVPIPENVLDDTAYDVWGTVKPLLEQALARTIDAAIFFGVNKPASWPNAIVTDAAADGTANTYVRGTSTAAQGGIAEDINQLMGKVEADGFDVNGFITQRTERARFRSARTTFGQPLLDVSTETVNGVPVIYCMPGLWPVGSGLAELIAGDFTQGILGIRKDITYKLLSEAVIQDQTGAIIYNLAQQDMVALRVTMRIAWQVSNTINYQEQVAGNRYPFSVLLQP